MASGLASGGPSGCRADKRRTSCAPLAASWAASSAAIGCSARATAFGLCRGFGSAATFAGFSGARSADARSCGAAKFAWVMSTIVSGFPLNGLGMPTCCEVRSGALCRSPSSPSHISSPVNTAPTTIKYEKIGIRIGYLQPEIQREGAWGVPVQDVKARR